jgi:hypothetical protein
MEQLIPVITIQKEENDSLVYRMSWAATDIKKKKTLFRFIGGYWRDSAMAYRELFNFERHFVFRLECNKGRHNNSQLQSIIKFLLAAHAIQKIQMPCTNINTFHLQL